MLVARLVNLISFLIDILNTDKSPNVFFWLSSFIVCRDKLMVKLFFYLINFLF